MRVVLDTNILVLGLLSSGGPPAQIVQALLQGRLVPIMSTATFAELEEVVHRPKLHPSFMRAGVNPAIFIATVRAAAHFVVPPPTHTPLRDERDRIFLDLMATHPPPQYFVTGDQDFEAPQYSGVPVVSAAVFVTLLKPP